MIRKVGVVYHSVQCLKCDPSRGLFRECEKFPALLLIVDCSYYPQTLRILLTGWSQMCVSLGWIFVFW